jgi:hypothetical protein
MRVPVTWLVVGILAALGGGFAAGRATSNRSTVEALEAQAAAMQAQGDALVQLQEQAARPVVLDAELRATLAQTPPACVQALGGDPAGPACLMLTCWSYGQSAAQRPECSQLQASVLQVLLQQWAAPQAAGATE